MTTSITEQTIVRLQYEDRANLIGSDTALARSLDFPSGHPVWCVWRHAKKEHEFFDATSTILSV